MDSPIHIQQQRNIAVIRFNRPEAFHAFDLHTIQTLAEKLTELACDPAVRGVVITGQGKVFCAGGDLKWISGYGPDRPGAAFHELAARYHQAILEIRRMPKPVVAAINGLAAGGGFSLALACDFRVMEDSAVLRQAYTSNGLSIDGGGTFTLPRLVGLARALEIAAFDPPIDAGKALEWGLVTEVVKVGGGFERAFDLAERVGQRSLDSFAASKRLLTDSFDAGLESHLEKERKLLSWCADRPAGREGIAAFVEKRKPAFNRR